MPTIPKMPKRLMPLPILLLLALPALAQSPGGPGAPGAPPDAKPAKPAEHPAPPPPEEKSSVTHHAVTVDGRAYPYTATAGNLLLKDEEGTVKASVFYIAYSLDGVKDPGSRPVTFSFNGGPGSASVWLHLGAFGPKSVERTDERRWPCRRPYRLVDNADTWLDQTDLVFIDPVGTGYSRAGRRGRTRSSSTASRRTSSRSATSSGCT